MLSTNNPFFYFDVWKGLGINLVGTQLTIDEYQELLRKGRALFSFTGRKATVCIVTTDKTLSRNDCLKFAIAFMDGKMEKTTIDLDKLTSTTVTVNPPP